MIACNVPNLQALYSRCLFLVIKGDYYVLFLAKLHNVAQGLAISVYCLVLF